MSNKYDKKIPLFSGGEAARDNFADFCELTDDQRAELHANPDKFIDDNFAGCSGETRALLNGYAGWPAFRDGMLMIVLPILAATALIVWLIS